MTFYAITFLACGSSGHIFPTARTARGQPTEIFFYFITNSCESLVPYTLRPYIYGKKRFYKSKNFHFCSDMHLYGFNGFLRTFPYKGSQGRQRPLFLKMFTILL